MANRFADWTLLAILLYYWWPTHLFVSPLGTTLVERVQAMRENRRRARFLLHYARRWALLSSVLFGVGALVEPPNTFMQMTPLGACSVGLYLAAILACTAMFVLLQGYVRAVSPERTD
jgi:hypothetical protein